MEEQIKQLIEKYSKLSHSIDNQPCSSTEDGQFNMGQVFAYDSCIADLEKLIEPPF
jgi:hypothetical protein